MKFDLIVPIFNIQEHLDACLSSIFRQTYRNFRAIMIDDGSTDGSSLIAQSYADKDARFEYYRKQNGGLSDARNFGLEKLMAEYVLFIDGDDYIELDLLEVVYQELLHNPVDVLEFNGWIVENGVRNRCVNTFYIDKGIIKSGRDYILDNVKSRGIMVPVWLKAVRSKVLLQNHLYFAVGKLHEDELWTPKLYFMADSVKYIDRCLYNYVQREGSITHQADRDKSARDAKEIYYQLEKYYRGLGLTRSQRNILTSCLSIQMIEVCRRSKREGMTPRDKEFIIRNAKGIRSVGNMLLFLVLPKHYELLSRVVKDVLG